MASAPGTLTFKNGDTLVPFRCRGCGAAMGWGTASPLVRVFCSPVCGYDGPLGADEERNDMIRNAIAAGLTARRVADVFMLTCQRVSQIQYPSADRRAPR